VSMLVATLAMIAIVSGGRVIVNRVANFTANHTQSLMLADLINNAYGYTLRHSYRFFSGNFSGALVRKIQRLGNSYETIDDAIKYQAIPLLVSVIGTIIIVWQRNVFLVAIIAVWIAVYAAVNVAYARWITPYNEQSAKMDSEVSGFLSDTISNNSNIALFSGLKSEEKSLARLSDKLRKLRRFRWNSYDTMFGIQNALNVAIEIAVLYYAIVFWSRGLLTVGDFVLLQTVLLILFNNLWGLNTIIRRFNDAIADAKEIIEILETPHEITDAPKAKKLKISVGAIAFDNVQFNYNETREVIKNFALEVKPREKIALVGSSGAGKSTIVKLVFRIYDLSGGRIIIDGQDISKVTQDSLHDALAMVPQDPILFHRSLMDNIRYGRRDATDEEVYEAAKKAHCHEFISNLAEGYQTMVGERGIKLSGGERQRVAIARAILKNAPILVLDEATSSLDSESELLIHEALQELMKNKTVIVIAHRLSTIMEMDRIAVVENGQVVDIGTHNELLERAGTYKKLWEIQAGGFIE
jgi:ATP-binding cassette, subfamily B, bacterial